MSEEKVNLNQKSAYDLRMIADWLENHPDLPLLNISINNYIFYKEDFLKFVAAAGTLKKKYDDDYIRVFTEFPGGTRVGAFISRERICEKIVTWKCPDESLLKLAEEVEQV